jgi:hypothetical protein
MPNRLPLLSVILWLLMASAAAQTTHERLPAEWILRYEQCWGVAGLYVDEPPPRSDNDEPARVRRELLELTQAARRLRQRDPAAEVTPGRLLVAGLLTEPVSPPEGADYVYSERHGRFVCTAGGPFDLVEGAMRQLRSAEDYRRRVLDGAPGLYRAWNDLLELPEVPEIIRREIETRRFAIQVRESGPMKAARQTQQSLAKLNDAIEMATNLGFFQPGQEITMQEVGRTGLIDLLEALPLGGKYVVTKVGEPPAAEFNGVRVPYDSRYIIQRLAHEARKALAEKPDYPPALALLAQTQGAAEGRATLDRAIDLWPDVPALRIQRLAMNARLLRMNELPADLEYLLQRFPAAPLCLEIDMATRKDVLAAPGRFRSTLASTMAEARPEVLNLQILAFKELLGDGDIDAAIAIRDRLVERHPGYEPLLPDPAARNADP